MATRRTAVGTDAYRIRGKTVSEPTSADDLKLLRYNHTTGLMEWATLGAGGDPTLGGDVTGLGSANTVVKIRGKTVPAPVAGDDEKLVAYDHDTGAFKYVVASGTSSVTMGGDVTGNSATSTVEKLRGRNVPLPGAGQDEQFLKYDHDTTACVWAAPPTQTPTMAGDVTGTTAASVVEKLRGRNVPTPGVSEDQLFLRYNHGTTAFVYAAPPTQTPTLAGDVTGTTAASVVEKIRGKNVPAPGAGQDEQILKYDHDTGAFVWIAQPTGGATNLDALTDVTIAGESAGYTLRHNGAGQFVSERLSTNDLADISTSSLANKQVLAYDAVTLLDWVNRTLDTSYLDDVAISSPAGGQVLTYNSGTSKWTNQTAAGGAPAVTTVEVNLGSVPKRAGRFTIAGAGMTVGKAVMIQQASGPYTGKGTRADEAEMDQVNVAAKVTSATVIEAFWHAPGPVARSVKFNYWISS
jgi:hypothetical protein